MINFIESVNCFIWGIPLMVLILSIGIYMTAKSRLLQLRLLPRATRTFFLSLRKDKSDSGVSPYRALCTALAATVGTGNLAGVAGAISIGGPGAVFWMWISGIIGMVIKFAEVICSMRYRIKMSNGEWYGGPMITIQKGMPEKFHFLASLFSFFGVIASFGIGNATQVNTIIGGIESITQTIGCRFSFVGKLIFGIALAAFIGYALSNGIQRIGKYTQVLVPLAAGTYILLAIGILVLRFRQIPGVMQSILLGAINPRAVTGGLVGSIFQTMRIGVSRGIFTNEAGMGTASIAHACTNANNPIEQGLLGIIEVFLDTIVICTLTALVILCCKNSIPYGTDTGIRLTMDAFSSVYHTWILIPLTLIICLLAIATILGWGFYGTRCAQFLFGDSALKWFVLLQAIAVILGVIGNTAVVWTLSELTNALMAFPNLIALGYFAPKLVDEIKAYRPT